jgi:hypothetical protein
LRACHAGNGARHQSRSTSYDLFERRWKAEPARDNKNKTTAGRHFLFIFYMPSSTQDHPALSYVKLLDRAVAPAGHAAGPAASKRSRTDAPLCGVKLMTLSLFCYFGRHTPRRSHMKWDGAHFVSTCRFCKSSIIKRRHRGRRSRTRSAGGQQLTRPHPKGRCCWSG